MNSVLFCIATISLVVTVGLTIAIIFCDDIVEKGYCACYVQMVINQIQIEQKDVERNDST